MNHALDEMTDEGFICLHGYYDSADLFQLMNKIFEIKQARSNPK